MRTLLISVGLAVMTNTLIMGFDAAGFAELKAKEISAIKGGRAIVKVVSFEKCNYAPEEMPQIEPVTYFYEQGLKIKTEINIHKKALTAARVIMKGEHISAADFVETEVDITRLNYEPVSDAEVLKDAVSDKLLQRGRALSRTDFSAPYYVHTGTEADIVIQDEAVMITAKGRAEEPGYIGDLIKVRNTKSRNIVYARVVAGPKFSYGGTK